MNNYIFYIYGKKDCGYFNNSINLLKSKNCNVITENSVDDMKKKIKLDLNIDMIKYNHNTSPMIFYGNKKKLLFIGGNDKITYLINEINSNINEKIKNELNNKNDIISNFILSCII